jgi:5-methyltetrahydrofolate--homocysteine methyltransferase
MAENKFKKLLNENEIIILDGSSGVAMQKRGMPKGVCPEKWALDNPEHLIDLQREYIKAGSKIIYTFTFGGSPVKLGEYGLRQHAYEINRDLAQISRRAAGERALVAGDIGPTGHFPEPFGDTPFEEMVDIFKEQARGLKDGGVDLFVIETFIDIQEARAAVLAVKEICDLPVVVSMTFDNAGKTITGTDPVSAAVTLQALGVDCVGVNCSTGPAEMVEVVRAIKSYVNIPIIAKPNAGLPRLVAGETVFNMNADEFSDFAVPLAEAGACLIGGCCGTSAEFISKTASRLRDKKPSAANKTIKSALSSARRSVFPGGGEFVIVGERINPTGKKQLQAELKEGKESEIRRFASEQEKKGASVLDVNVGMPGINEKEVMVRVVKLLSAISELPLCIDSSTPEVIEAALRIYPGKALINSISGEKSKYEKLLPLAAKYGAMFILLPLTEKGIPETADGRMKVVNEVVAAAEKLGIGRENIAVDGLVMTVSSDQGAAVVTLDVIEKCGRGLGLNTIVGLSNVSFGLPARAIINSTFFNLARSRGLSMAIANPELDLTVDDKSARDLLLGADKNASLFIAKYGAGNDGASKPKTAARGGIQPADPEKIYDCVITGDKENIVRHIEAALKAGEKPSDIVDKKLIPAIAQVGEYFDKKKFFLPQLIQSAEAMKAGFAILEPLLVAAPGTVEKKKTGVVLATVKGDIHDIGKNIVALMLKNYGFEVYDLGKDVGADLIISKAREVKAEIIGLSALMTTTMVEMAEVIRLSKQEKLDIKFMVGGAVVTAAYAEEIGAHGYSKDAYEAVKTAKRLANL